MLGHSVESHNRIAESNEACYHYISIKYRVDVLLSGTLRDERSRNQVLSRSIIYEHIAREQFNHDNRLPVIADKIPKQNL